MNYSKHSNNMQRKQKKARAAKVTHAASGIALRVVVIGIIVVGFMLAGAAFGAYMGVVESSPEITISQVTPQAYTSIIYDQNGAEIDRLHGEENREYAYFVEIPTDFVNAVVAVEDERFYEHNGVDIKGMARALYVNLKENDLSEGASTITQQLIKNNILKDPSKKWRRKLQEQYMAIEYEKALTKYTKDKRAAKNYILELYLNSIPLGHGNNGVKAAARYYFDKSLSELTLSECAVLAGITNNPSLYSPKSSPEGNAERKEKILKSMLEQGYIDQARYDEAMADTDVYTRIANVFQNVEENEYYHSYFVDQVIEDIAKDLQVKKNITEVEAFRIIYNGGLKVNTTLDQHMQAIMDEKYKDDSLFPESEFEYKVLYFLSVTNSGSGETTHYSEEYYVDSKEEIPEYLEARKAEMLKEGDTVLGERYEAIPQPQSAMVIMDFHTGQVKALTGGRGDKRELGQRPLNRATQSPRQPGSVFKVLSTYAPGIDSQKITAATVINDAPLKIGSKEFKNWWGSSYKGPMTVRQGVIQSANIVTVRCLLDKVGFDTMWDYLMNFGFTTLADNEVINGEIYDDRNPATALGGVTHGVTVMELTGAFGAIANQGMYNKPVLYTTVLDHDGNVLLDSSENQQRQVLTPQSAYILTDMMEEVITSPAGTGGYAGLRNTNIPVAGKTGTTSDDKDLAFAGYTPYYVSAIWLGHDKPKEMTYWNSPHLRLWRAIMEEVHEPLEYKEFDRPDGIVSATVCGYSGDLPRAGCKSVTDLFIPGTVPSKYCSSHAFLGSVTGGEKQSEATGTTTNTDGGGGGTSSGNTPPVVDPSTSDIPPWLGNGGNSSSDNNNSNGNSSSQGSDSGNTPPAPITPIEEPVQQPQQPEGYGQRAEPAPEPEPEPAPVVEPPPPVQQPPSIYEEPVEAAPPSIYEEPPAIDPVSE